MSDSTVRAFIAIELPAHVKQELRRIGEQLAGQLPPRIIRWVQPDHMHLTLRFLGDTAVAQILTLGQQLDELAIHFTPFSLQLGELGCFPSLKRPRVIWIGVAGDEQILLAVKQELDERLALLGWAAETKQFSAHLTIGRVGDGRYLPPVNWNLSVNPLTFAVHHIHLIQSRLTPKGPIYTVQHTAVLRDGNG